MTCPDTLEHAAVGNALNTRQALNHRQWFDARSEHEGSSAHWLAQAAAGASEQPARIGLMSLRRMSTSQLSRGWGDLSIAETAESIGQEASSANAFSIASRMLGLGRRCERVGALGAEPVLAPAADSIGRLLAMAEFDNNEPAQAIFVQMARAALRSKGTHLCIHSGYGPRNGYRGAHALIDLGELAGAKLTARSSSESGKGAAIHVGADFGGRRIELVSFKRKGGDGPSEKYGDHLQATLLAKGAVAAASTLAGTATLVDTGRAIHLSLPAALAA